MISSVAGLAGGTVAATVTVVVMTAVGDGGPPPTVPLGATVPPEASDGSAVAGTAFDIGDGLVPGTVAGARSFA